VFRVAGAVFLISTLSAGTYAGPPHYGGLPPGLQKKVERGEGLPPGWSKKTGMYDYGYDDVYYDQYEPEYIEDKVVRIIKDVRDLSGSLPR
jgi:hypothetical protein